MRCAENNARVYPKRRDVKTQNAQKIALRTSCLDRFWMACVVFTNLETDQLLSLQGPSCISTDRFPLPQYAVRRVRSQWSSAAFFPHLRMAASMIYPIPDLHRIHPYEILNLVIPYHIKLLLANGTWLVGKSWVGWDRDVLILGVSSGQRSGKSGSCCIRGVICEPSILRIVPRFDPLLVRLVEEPFRDRRWNNLPIHQRTSFGSGPAWSTRLDVGSFENANPDDGPSSLYPLL